MKVPCAMTLLLFTCFSWAQSGTVTQTSSEGSAPPVATTCPANRPVDDMIAEVHKDQSKKKHRNPNPFPDVACIWGWCRSHTPTPPLPKGPAQGSETATQPTANQTTSSSKRLADSCDTAMEAALQAAHDVEVGDYYFDQKNYRAALIRYQSASEEKVGDAAIHVRLGRAFEKLNEVPQAVAQYKTATTLEPPPDLLQEARSALARLHRNE